MAALSKTSSLIRCTDTGLDHIRALGSTFLTLQALHAHALKAVLGGASHFRHPHGDSTAHSFLSRVHCA